MVTKRDIYWSPLPTKHRVSAKARVLRPFHASKIKGQICHLPVRLFVKFRCLTIRDLEFISTKWNEWFTDVWALLCREYDRLQSSSSGSCAPWYHSPPSQLSPGRADPEGSNERISNSKVILIHFWRQTVNLGRSTNLNVVNHDGKRDVVGV